MRDLKDYIVVIDNIVPAEVADAVLAEYADSDEWRNTTIQNGENLSVRNCQSIGISFSENIRRNPEVRSRIDHSIFQCASKSLYEYKQRFQSCTVEKDSGYDLLKYKEGGFYKQHTDSFKDTPREVSCSFALNDEFDGGEFAFFDKELVYKLNKGSCILFPSNFMYPHEVTPVSNGTRYSIVTWFI